MIRVRLLRAALAAAALAPAVPALAQVVDITWSQAGTFERELSVAPGKFAELCGALRPGQAVRWSFTGSQAMDFNIHFHEGKEVRYPQRSPQVLESQGTLAVDAAQDYCWMWTNTSAAAASLRVRLQRS